MEEELEPEVMVVGFDDGTESVEFSGQTRIQRAAFLKREDDQNIVFDGFICEGIFSDEDKQVLKDYSWVHLIDFEKEDECLGQSIYANLELQMVEYTAEVLAAEIEYPKHSLVYLLD